MRVQVVADQSHLPCERIILLQQHANLFRPVDSRSVVAATHPSPPGQGIKEQKQSLGSSSVVLKIFSPGTTRGRKNSRLFVPEQLLARLIHADQRLIVGILVGVDVE